MKRNGVYSGSAFVENNTIYYFYTGNVKLTDRNGYDYIHEGREQNTICCKSEDGFSIDKKELIMSNKHYPSNISKHVRDPKIIKKDENYYLILGARTNDNQGCVLLYKSQDLKNFEYFNTITTPKRFGYMWECPDLFELDDYLFLVVCPQGVKQSHFNYENIYPLWTRSYVIESLSITGTVIKSHHNVGGLPAKMNLKLVEPLRLLFKDEVRRVGMELGMQPHLIKRHPFPGPGLGIRILGDITPEKVRILQEADDIYMSLMREWGLYDKIWQAGVILLPIQSVGVMGDERTYENTVALRAVTSTDAMTADWAQLPYEFLAKVSNEIINKVKGVNRVVYDISSKPPATIEWE